MSYTSSEHTPPPLISAECGTSCTVGSLLSKHADSSFITLDQPRCCINDFSERFLRILFASRPWCALNVFSLILALIENRSAPRAHSTFFHWLLIFLSSVLDNRAFQTTYCPFYTSGYTMVIDRRFNYLSCFVVAKRLHIIGHLSGYSMGYYVSS